MQDLEKKLKEYYYESLKMITDANIQIGIIKELKLGNAKKTFGTCKKNKDGTFNIIISKITFEGSKEGIINTIIHEIIHTCKDCFNHGREFKKICNIMNVKYNLNLSTTTSFEKKGISIEKKQIFNYVIKCEKCGCEIGFIKNSKVVKFPNLYKCGKCKGNLKRIK